MTSGALSPRQFFEERRAGGDPEPPRRFLTRQEWLHDQGTPATTSYTLEAYDPTAGRAGRYGAAIDVDVQHSRPREATYAIPNPGGNDPTDLIIDTTDPYQFHDWQAKEDYLQAHYETDQPKLFGHSETQPRSEVRSMYAAKGYRAEVMGVLGVAQRDVMQRFGRTLEASNDLSEHSGPLVEHLVERGAVKNPGWNRDPNDLDWTPFSTHSTVESQVARMAAYDEEGQLVPPAEHAAGKRLARNLLRAGRRPTYTGSQGMLPGFEGPPVPTR